MSVAAIVCTSLGIGANSAVFSVAASLLARNIRGVQEPGRLVAVHRTDRGSCCSENSYPVYDDLRRQTSVFESVEAHYPLLSVTLDDASGPVRIWGQVVSPEYFDVLKTPLTLGHSFRSAEPGLVVISHSLWQRRFGSDPSIIGQRVSLNRAGFTILGVAPPLFRGPDLAVGADLWVSVGSLDQVMPQHPSLQDRTAAWLVVYARLQPGVSLARAQAQLNLLANRLAREHAGSDAARGFLAEPAAAFHPSYRGAVVNVTVIVAALVLLVLIVACANVANILLSRASGRQKEIAIRAALGAGRCRLIRGMLAESMVLALLGGCAGVALSWTLLRVAASFRLPVSLPLEFRFETDWRVLAFAAGLSLATGLLFGILPALRASTVNLLPGLKNGDSSGRGSRWAASDALVLVQVSLAVFLLIFTALFLRSLTAASGVNPGFRAGRLLLVDLDPRTSGGPATVMERLRSRLEALPGVTSATFTDVVPLGLGSRAANIRRAEDTESASTLIRADMFQVGPRFFETLGIRLLSGREFGLTGEPLEGVAMINSAAAAHLWPGQDPVGRHLRRAGRTYRVLGVVNNIKTRTVGESERPCVFVPLPGSDRSDPIPFGLTLAVRTAGEPLQAAASVRQAIGELEPLLAISNVRTMAQHIDGALVFPRAGALVFGAFGVIAIVLTSAGLYGVISYSVARRTREFGIRFAVGARYADVLRIVIVRGAVVSGAGVALGLAAACFGTRVLRTLLYGVAPHDPVSFTIVPLMVTAVSLLACYIPAHRVARIDPLAALRSD